MVSLDKEIQSLDFKLRESKLLKKYHTENTKSMNMYPNMLDEFNDDCRVLTLSDNNNNVKSKSTALGKRNWKDVIGSIKIPSYNKNLFEKQNFLPEVGVKDSYKIEEDMDYYCDSDNESNYQENYTKKNYNVNSEYSQGIQDGQGYMAKRQYIRRTDKFRKPSTDKDYLVRSCRKETQKRVHGKLSARKLNLQPSPSVKSNILDIKQNQKAKDMAYSMYLKRQERVIKKSLDPRTRASIRMAEKFGAKDNMFFGKFLKTFDSTYEKFCDIFKEHIGSNTNSENGSWKRS